MEIENKELTPVQQEEKQNMEDLKNGTVPPKRKRGRPKKTEQQKAEDAQSKINSEQQSEIDDEKNRLLEEDFLFGLFMGVVDKLKQHSTMHGIEYPDRRYNSWKQVNREGARRLSFYTKGYSFYGLLGSLVVEESIIFLQIRKLKKQLQEQQEQEQERYGNTGNPNPPNKQKGDMNPPTITQEQLDKMS